MRTKQKSAFADRKMLGRAIKDSFAKLSPKTQAKNPVMFLVFVSAILTSILWVVSLFGLKDAPSGYTLAIAIILWFTVLFANFAEAIAEGRGKAQADSLRASRKDVDAHKIPSVSQKESVTVVPSALLKKGELVIVKAGEQIPADGEVIEGAASVDESAITGESAPVIREAGGDRSAVTGGCHCTVGLDCCQSDQRSRRKLSGQDDCDGRRCCPEEDAQRNCFADFSGSLVHYLYLGDSLPLHVFHFFCKAGGN